MTEGERGGGVNAPWALRAVNCGALLLGRLCLADRLQDSWEVLASL